MASSRRIIFAGVGTTFVILPISFSGGLMLGKHAWTRQLPSGAMDRARTALLMRFWSACGVAGKRGREATLSIQGTHIV